jgi:hypothetical protein
VGQEGTLERKLAQIALKRKLQQELEKTKKANQEILGQKQAFAKEKEEFARARKEVECKYTGTHTHTHNSLSHTHRGK